MLQDHGLPADWSQIVCKEAALQLLPVNEIMTEIDNVLPDEDYFVLYDIYSTFKFLAECYEQKFGDWEYQFAAMGFWEVNEVVGELIAKKSGVELELLVAFQSFVDGFSKYPRDEVMEKFYNFLCRCNDNIYEWNKVAANHLPIINSRPPFKVLKEDMVEFFEIFYVEDEWNHYRQTAYNDEGAFIDEHLFYLPITLTCMSHSMVEWDGFHLGFQTLGTNYDYFLLRIYLEFDEVDMTFIVYEEFTNSEYDYVEFTYSETLDMFDRYIDIIETNLLQWNKTIKEGGFE